MTGDRNIPLKGKRQSKPISKPLFNLIVKRAEHSIVEINIGKDNPKKFALVNSFSEEEWNGEWGKTFRDKYPGLAKKVLEDKNSKNTKKYKLVIGQGNYGKVRLAREIDVKTGNPGKYVIVKKQRVTDDESKENARAEYWFQTKYLPPNEDFYVRTLAGAETTNKKGEPTIYTFMEIADSGDGDSIIKQLHPTSSEPKKQTIDGDEIETYENEKQPVGFGDSEDKKILFLRFLSSATTSLKKLHDKNIRHRDIKPGNYLYFSNGDIKLADFGAAISTQKDAESYVSGNFDTAYWSLEMIKKEGIIPNLDLWALKDSWALGITFLQAYYGVIREIKKDGGLYIKVLNPKGANLAEYFKKIGNPDNWKTVDFLALLSPLIENISDPDLKILIQGLLESDMSKRFSLEQAEQNLQPILKKSKDTQDKAVRTDEQLAKKETAAQLPAATISSSNPNPQPPKAATVVMSGPRAITPDEERRLKEHLTALERVYVKKDNDNKPIEDKDGKTIRDDEAQPLLDARQAIIRMVDDNPAILYSLGDNKIDLIIKILESTPPDKQFDCFKIVLSTCKTLISYKRVFDLLEKTNLAFANKSKLITICVDSLVDSLAESSEIIKNDIEALRSNLAELYTLIKLLNISVSETNTSSIRNKMSSLMENIGLGENSKIDLPAMRSSNDTLHSSKQEITVETYQKIRAQLDKLSTSPLQTALEKEQKRKSQLKKAVDEFYSTQKFFHEQVQQLIDHFCHLVPDEKVKGKLKIVFKKDSDFLQKGEETLSEAQKNELKLILEYFINLRDNPFGDRDPDDIKAVENINRTILEMGDKFTLMMQAFRDCAVVTEGMIEFVSKIIKKSSGFKLIDERYPISQFLILPVQRVCKYPLLLREIINVLPTNSPIQIQTQKANSQISEKVARINTQKADIEKEAATKKLPVDELIRHYQSDTLTKMGNDIETNFKELKCENALPLIKQLIDYGKNQSANPIRMNRAKKIIEIIDHLSDLKSTDEMVAYLNALLQSNDPALKDHTGSNENRLTTLEKLIRNITRQIIPKDTFSALSSIESNIADKKTRDELHDRQMVENQYQQLIISAAEELREVSHYLFSQISDTELGNTSEDEPKSIKNLALKANALVNKVKSDILFADHSDRRLLVTERWIAILQQCFLNGDMSSVESILTALDSPEISNLNLISLISKQAQKIFNDLHDHTQRGDIAFTVDAEFCEKIISNRKDKVVPFLKPYTKILLLTKESMDAIEDKRQEQTANKILQIMKKDNFHKKKEYKSLLKSLSNLHRDRTGAKDVLKLDINIAIAKLTPKLEMLIPKLTLIRANGIPDRDSNYLEELKSNVEKFLPNLKNQENSSKSKNTDNPYLSTLDNFIKTSRNQDEKVKANALLNLAKKKIYDEKLTAINTAIQEKNKEAQQLITEFYSISKTAENEILTSNAISDRRIAENQNKITCLTRTLTTMKSNLGDAPNPESFTPFQKYIYSGKLEHSEQELRDAAYALKTPSPKQGRRILVRSKAAPQLTNSGKKPLPTFAIEKESAAIAAVPKIRTLLNQITAITSEHGTLGSVYIQLKDTTNEQEKELRIFLTELLEQISFLKNSESFSNIAKFISSKAKEIIHLIPNATDKSKSILSQITLGLNELHNKYLEVDNVFNIISGESPLANIVPTEQLPKRAPSVPKLYHNTQDALLSRAKTDHFSPSIDDLVVKDPMYFLIGKFPQAIHKVPLYLEINKSLYRNLNVICANAIKQNDARVIEYIIGHGGINKQVDTAKADQATNEAAKNAWNAVLSARETITKNTHTNLANVSEQLSTPSGSDQNKIHSPAEILSAVGKSEVMPKEQPSAATNPVKKDDNLTKLAASLSKKSLQQVGHTVTAAQIAQNEIERRGSARLTVKPPVTTPTPVQPTPTELTSKEIENKLSNHIDSKTGLVAKPIDDLISANLGYFVKGKGKFKFKLKHKNAANNINKMTGAYLKKAQEDAINHLDYSTIERFESENASSNNRQLQQELGDNFSRENAETLYKITLKIASDLAHLSRKVQKEGKVETALTNLSNRVKTDILSAKTLPERIFAITRWITIMDHANRGHAEKLHDPLTVSAIFNGLQGCGDIITSHEAGLPDNTLKIFNDTKNSLDPDKSNQPVTSSRVQRKLNDTALNISPLYHESTGFMRYDTLTSPVSHSAITTTPISPSKSELKNLKNLTSELYRTPKQIPMKTAYKEHDAHSTKDLLDAFRHPPVEKPKTPFISDETDSVENKKILEEIEKQLAELKKKPTAENEADEFGSDKLIADIDQSNMPHASEPAPTPKPPEVDHTDIHLLISSIIVMLYDIHIQTFNELKLPPTTTTPGLFKPIHVEIKEKEGGGEGEKFPGPGPIDVKG